MKIIARHIAATMAIVAAGLSLPAAHAQEFESHTIGGFEDDSEGWSLNLGTEFPGAQGSFNLDASDPAEGESSALLTGDFADGGNYVQIGRDLDLDVQELRLWVRSGDLEQVGLRMTDSTGQTHQQRLPLEPGGDWQELTVAELDGGLRYAHFGGANDGVWHGPATGIALMLPRTALLPDRTGGEVRFDDIVVTAPVVLPDLQIDQVALGNVFVQPEIPEVNVVTRGDTVSWSVRDFWDEEVARGTGPGGEVALSGLVDRAGYYQLEITAELDGAPIATETTDLALLSPFDVSEVEDSPFGTVPHFTREDNFDKVALAAKMGAKNIREAAGWSSIEQEPGTYSYNRYDPLKSALAANSINWLPVASYTNQYYDGNATPYTDEGREGYANYAAAVVDHYDDVEWIEIYNEFNIKVFGARGGSPANSQANYYFPLLKAAYTKIKEADPDVTVVGGATSSVPLDWLEELFSLGGLEYMDVISVHPYIFPAEPEAATELLEELAKLIKEYNDGELIPIWITEQGYSTYRHARGVSEPTQAVNLVRSYVTAFSAGVDRFFWYNFMNTGTDPNNREHNYGIIRRYNDDRGAYVPKPAYVSYAAMARMLTGASYDRAEDVGDGIQSHVFTTDGNDLRVLWADEPTTVTVRSDGPVTVTDVMGASRTYRPHAGRVYLSLSGAPIYLEGTDLRVETAAKVELTADQDVSIAGEPIELTLTVDNATTPRAPFVGEFQIAGESVPVSVRPGQHAAIPISIPAQESAGDPVLVGELILHGAPSARLAVSVPVREPIEVAAQHVLSDGVGALAVTATNLADHPIEVGDVGWSVGELSGTADLPVALAGASHTVEISLAGLAPGDYERQLTVPVPGRPDVSLGGTVTVVDQGSLVGVAQRSVEVDGILDDMTGVPGVDLVTDGRVGGRWTTASEDAWIYGGEEDLSGDVWPTWDEDNFYVSARVRDNVHHQRSPQAILWSGDTLSLTMAAGTPGEETPLHYYTYRIALAQDGPVVYREITAGEPVGVVTDAEVAITRDEETHQTVYEVALPWHNLAPVDPADGLLSLSLQVDDNDGLDRKGWIGWSTKPVRLDQ